MKKAISLFVFFFSFQVFSFGISYKQLILNQLNSPHRIFQFFSEVKTTTYSLDLQEQITDIYFQDILWIRNEFLVIEIFSENNNQSGYEELAYLYYDNKKTNKKFKKYFSSFSELDIEGLFTGFYAKTEDQLLKFYRSLGINYFIYKIVEENKKYYYQLGEKTSYILFNIHNYRPEKLVRTIYYNSKPFQYVVLFKNWDSQKIFFPKTIEYYLENQLIKRDDVGYLQWRGLAAKRNLLIEKYSE